MLRTLKDGESVHLEDPADFGRLVPVRLKKIIHRVIAHPMASREFKGRVDALLGEHLKHIRCADSIIL
jgi:IS5 family transposase